MRWNRQIPVTALRLSLTVQQAAGGGMTCYFTIKEAMRTYRNFAWAGISLLLPTDWNNYYAAVRLVGNNVYYGFNKDLGAAKSTLYKNLGWVAKELLLKVGGNTAISRYAVWPARVPNMTALDQLIDAYVASRATAVGPDEIDAMNANAGFQAQFALMTLENPPAVAPVQRRNVVEQEAPGNQVEEDDHFDDGEYIGYGESDDEQDEEDAQGEQGEQGEQGGEDAHDDGED